MPTKPSVIKYLDRQSHRDYRRESEGVSVPTRIFKRSPPSKTVSPQLLSSSRRAPLRNAFHIIPSYPPQIESNIRNELVTQNVAEMLNDLRIRFLVNQEQAARIAASGEKHFEHVENDIL
jgi:hypothetical protein